MILLNKFCKRKIIIKFANIKIDMKQLSVTEYSKLLGLTRQAILVQIWQNRLPKGVISKKIGNTYIIIIIEEEKN